MKNKHQSRNKQIIIKIRIIANLEFRKQINFITINQKGKAKETKRSFHNEQTMIHHQILKQGQDIWHQINSQ